MIIPRLKALGSPDLEEPDLPDDPSDCEILIELSVGPDDETGGAEIFSFTVVTPTALAREQLPRWGRGKLIVSHFDWAAVRHAAERLLAHAGGESWRDVATSLSREFAWEFEDYSAG